MGRDDRPAHDHEHGSSMTKPGWAALLLAGALSSSLSFADERRTFGLEGQVSFGLTLHDQPPEKLILGLRYIPTLTLKHDLGSGLSLDVEASVNMTATARGSGLNDLQADGRLRPYRLWARLSTKQFEARLGLQKINFGSAMLLRPLMWFDRIDPNDPLQLTDGVYGLLLKYTFLNNANIWLWGLLGNNDVKGWETDSHPSRRARIRRADSNPRSGGRTRRQLSSSAPGHGEKPHRPPARRALRPARRPARGRRKMGPRRRRLGRGRFSPAGFQPRSRPVPKMAEPRRGLHLWRWGTDCMFWPNISSSTFRIKPSPRGRAGTSRRLPPIILLVCSTGCARSYSATGRRETGTAS